MKISNALNQHNNTRQELDLLKNKMLSDLNVASLVRLLKPNRTLNRLWIDDCNLFSKGTEK